MKKKIINGFLMAALMLTATTSFVSCKDNVDDEMVGVYNNLAKQKKELQDQIGALEKRVNENAEAIKKNSEAIQDLQNDIEEINAELASLDTRLTKAEEDIKKLQEDLDAVGKRIDELEKTVEELIGGLVQDFYAEHTVNHVIGSINTPFVQSLSLAAFYGTNETLIEEFPTSEERFIVDQANGARITDSDIQGAHKIQLGEILTQPEGNAGKLYFTARGVNHEKFNINDYKLTLMNSVGKVAPVTLSNIKLSDYQVQWGFYKSQELYSMGQTKDDWFEADATIADADLAPNKFSIKKFIDFDGLKKDFKAAWEEIKAGRPYETKDEAIKTIGRAAARILINFYSGKMSANNTDLNNMSYSPQRLVLSKVMDDGTEYIMKQTKLEIAATAVAPLAYTAFWAYEKDAKVPTEKIADVEKVVTKIGEKVGATKMASKVNTYLEKGANYIVNKINNHQLTRAISPIILCNGANGEIFRMTDNTTLEGAGTLEIMMTSPTEELLAPAYEKYIAVVDTENGKVRQQATVPGSTQYWTLDFPKAGTYKVVLSCVDYYGNIINKTHTVTVK
jgi:TolA-binding protein